MIKFRVRTGITFVMLIGVILWSFVSLSGMQHRRRLCAMAAQRQRGPEEAASALLAREIIVLSKLKSGAYPHLTEIQRGRAIRSMSRYIKGLERTVEANHRLRIAFEDVVDHPWRTPSPKLLDIADGG